MRRYYRVTLGSGNEHAKNCFIGNFIGIDYDIRRSLAIAVNIELYRYQVTFKLVKG